MKTKARKNSGNIRIIYNRLLGGWYVVRGPHQTPLNGRFNSKAEAQAWLRRHNPGLFGSEAVARAKQVKRIRKVQERDTKEAGEIIEVKPGGWLKVKWDNRQRPTLIKRSEIKRYPYVRNPKSRAFSYRILHYENGKVNAGDVVFGSRAIAIVGAKAVYRNGHLSAVIQEQTRKVVWKSAGWARKNPGIMDLISGGAMLIDIADKAGPKRRNPERDSAGAIDVIRYYVSPRPTLRNWWVKGVRVSDDGREIGNNPKDWIPTKTKTEAKHLATQLNKELKRFDIAVTEGLDF